LTGNPSFFARDSAAVSVLLARHLLRGRARYPPPLLPFHQESGNRSQESGGAGMVFVWCLPKKRG
jgi:hypothetical protein